ncbi:hypothetical protein P7K49_027662 [Saguinus oedipus]|uniref:Uncharacterized protein n=1 Tax=Saguinus oedipus TaxID=9490 RepID=A0ABQ9UAV8_SAGOE|nr:hypothetical protein P7K49_027662 [Saguinus oedipus]
MHSVTSSLPGSLAATPPPLRRLGSGNPWGRSAWLPPPPGPSPDSIRSQAARSQPAQARAPAMSSPPSASTLTPHGRSRPTPQRLPEGKGGEALHPGSQVADGLVFRVPLLFPWMPGTLNCEPGHPLPPGPPSYPSATSFRLHLSLCRRQHAPAARPHWLGSLLRAPPLSSHGHRGRVLSTQPPRRPDWLGETKGGARDDGRDWAGWT